MSNFEKIIAWLCIIQFILVAIVAMWAYDYTVTEKKNNAEILKAVKAPIQMDLSIKHIYPNYEGQTGSK